MKVYVVRWDTFDEQDILAVFTTLEAAKAFVVAERAAEQAAADASYERRKSRADLWVKAGGVLTEPVKRHAPTTPSRIEEHELRE